MKINLSKYLIAAFSVLILGSCSSDFLEKTPTELISEDAATADADALTLAINGIHRSMYMRYEDQNQMGAGGVMQQMDIAGDDLVYPASNGWYLSVYNWTAVINENSAEIKFPYRTFYRIIRNANAIINNADAATGSQTVRNMVKGQALLYRAFGHFQLVQIYAKRYVNGTNNSQDGVPLALTTTDMVGRSSVEDVYKQINKDLDDAMVLLDGYKKPDNSNLDLSVANGLKARVNLVQGNWAVAADYAAKAKVGKSLMSIAEYTKGFNDYTNVEWMWGSDIIELQTEYFGNFGAYMSRNFSSSVIRASPKAINSKLYNQIPATDVRAALFSKTGEHPTLNLAGFNKYPYTSQKYLAVSTGDSRCDVPYMRVAEMYLIEAEAKARLGSADAAQVLFNLVSKRDPAYVLSAKTGQALVDEILFQRRIELWGEGFRFLDLKRTNSDLDRTGANHSTIFTGGVLSVPASDKRWQWLIPRAEINANPLVRQNEL
ncbi:RagB/SusD family nutrient uptake outer membrane protein [Flavobacterium sp. ABG]|uniref:RagB/SusD family nutrient uptake outer membrane protein n=2 Tax=Flavobacterium TaxID=237 RepID=UPI00064AFE63|nr:RagB/SusD family nutrient uptake outer membrane protein [Flavobacterium sp. ABG]KLT68898.1 carbohydrate-binding protein SusD [Flavobacterium sp. ABG]